MLLKTADDKTGDLAELERLLALPLNRRQQEGVSREILNIQRGMKGERDAAYFIDHFFHDSDATVVLHDLRIDHEGEVTQIDHLLLTRFRMAYVVETKNYGGRLYRAPDGNWKCYYGAGKGIGYDIASPTEQARRHCKTLERWFKAAGLRVFDRVEPVVMIQPDQRVPKLAGPDQGFVFIKADNLRLWWQDQRAFGGALGTLWRVATRISFADLEQVGQALLDDHQPLERDWRARFGIPATLQPSGAQPEARAPREPTKAPVAPSIPTEQVTPAPAAPTVSADTPARPAPTVPPPSPRVAADGVTLLPPTSIAASSALGESAAGVTPPQAPLVPADVATPCGVVSIKRVTDGRYALRYDATDELVTHVRAVVKPLGGEWQARFRNWLVPPDRIAEVVARLAEPVGEPAPERPGPISVELVAIVPYTPPAEVVTLYGPVAIKRITDGRYALRHDDAEPLVAHVRGQVGEKGQWQARYRNWLVAPEHIHDVVVALGVPVTVVSDRVLA